VVDTGTVARVVGGADVVGGTVACVVGGAVTGATVAGGSVSGGVLVEIESAAIWLVDVDAGNAAVEAIGCGDVRS
jgi:hypothetical protein